MIKLLSFLVFAAAMLWSWFLFNSRNSIGVDIHAGVQVKLATLIEETIKKNRPQSTDFQLLQIYTEKVDENRIRAQFSFRYTDGADENESATQTLKGEVLLNKGLSENPDIQKWIVQSVKTNSTNVEFKDGLVISAENKLEGSNGTTTESSDSESSPAQTTTNAPLVPVNSGKKNK